MGYCAKTMRREYRGMLRTLLIDAGMIWFLAAAIGIVTAARHWRDKVPLLVCMALVEIGLAFWGAYLVAGDEKWPLRHTPFGLQLTADGDARALLRRMDEKATRPVYTGASFLLLQSWLLLDYMNGCRLEPYRMCVRLIPRHAVADVGVARAPQEENGFFLTIRANGNEYTCYTEQIQDAEALKEWTSIPQKRN